MENQSPFLAMQRTETQIKALLRTMDTDLLDADQKKAVASLRRLVREARLDIRDYELSETRAEQMRKLRDAQSRLAQLRTTMLAIGGMLSPADVAHLDAQIEQIRDRVI